MTNSQIILEHIETMGIEFNYDGKNLLSFAQWKRQGMSVRKGEKAFIKLKLWTCKEVNEKDEDGNIIKENGKPKKEKKFYLKTTALFKQEQVEEVKKKAA